MEQILRGIMSLVYSSPHSVEVSLQAVSESNVAEDAADLDFAIAALNRNRLIHLRLSGNTIRRTVVGKSAFDSDCYCEMVLGQEYIHHKYRNAVVHIIVLNQQGDEAGGTGFYSSDYPDHVVTARHVAAQPGYRILRIEDRQGNVISDNIANARIPEDQTLDLALIPCAKPAQVVPLRIEWRNEELDAHSPILVLGYPLVAGHEPALIHATGEVIGVPTRTDSERVSLLISRVTQPGFSGGPVISSSGRVLGVVERENVVQQVHDSIFITAVPALYLREVHLGEVAGNAQPDQ